MQETLPWRKDRPRSNYPTDAGTVETEDASEAGAEAVFTDELLKSVEAADINSLQPGMAGFSICSADIFGLLCFVYFSGARTSVEQMIPGKSIFSSREMLQKAGLLKYPLSMVCIM